MLARYSWFVRSRTVQGAHQNSAATSNAMMTCAMPAESGAVVDKGSYSRGGPVYTAWTCDRRLPTLGQWLSPSYSASDGSMCPGLSSTRSCATIPGRSRRVLRSVRRRTIASGSIRPSERGQQTPWGNPGSVADAWATRSASTWSSRCRRRSAEVVRGVIRPNGSDSPGSDRASIPAPRH